MFILNLGDTMNITIKKWGNSQGIILPKLVLDSLGFGIDDNLDLEIQNNKIVLSKARENFDDFSDLILEDLIKEGYEGEELLMEFRKIKNNFPEARKNLEKDLLDEYKFGEMLDYEELFNDQAFTFKIQSKIHKKIKGQEFKK